MSESSKEAAWKPAISLFALLFLISIAFGFWSEAPGRCRGVGFLSGPWMLFLIGSVSVLVYFVLEAARHESRPAIAVLRNDYFSGVYVLAIAIPVMWAAVATGGFTTWVGWKIGSGLAGDSFLSADHACPVLIPAGWAYRINDALEQTDEFRHLYIAPGTWQPH